LWRSLKESKGGLSYPFGGKYASGFTEIAAIVLPDLTGLLLLFRRESYRWVYGFIDRFRDAYAAKQEIFFSDDFRHDLPVFPDGQLCGDIATAYIFDQCLFDYGF
jgi:hypothetical protein